MALVALTAAGFAAEPRVSRIDLTEGEGGGTLVVENRIPETPVGVGVGGALVKVVDTTGVLSDSRKWDNLISFEVREAPIKAADSRWFEVRKKFQTETASLYYGESTCFMRVVDGKFDALKVSDPDKDDLEDLCVIDAGAMSWEYESNGGTPSIKVINWNDEKHKEEAVAARVYKLSGEGKVWKKEPVSN